MNLQKKTISFIHVGAFIDAITASFPKYTVSGALEIEKDLDFFSRRAGYPLKRPHTKVFFDVITQQNRRHEYPGYVFPYVVISGSRGFGYILIYDPHYLKPQKKRNVFVEFYCGNHDHLPIFKELPLDLFLNQQFLVQVRKILRTYFNDHRQDRRHPEKTFSDYVNALPIS